MIDLQEPFYSEEVPSWDRTYVFETQSRRKRTKTQLVGSVPIVSIPDRLVNTLTRHNFYFGFNLPESSLVLVLIYVKVLYKRQRLAL